MLGKHGNAKLNAKGVVMHCDSLALSSSVEMCRVIFQPC